MKCIVNEQIVNREIDRICDVRTAEWYDSQLENFQPDMFEEQKWKNYFLFFHNPLSDKRKGKSKSKSWLDLYKHITKGERK